VSLYATEKLPQPAAIEAFVDNDVLSRTLSVRLSQREMGYTKLLWREAFQALQAAEEDGWRRHPFLWASVPGAREVAHVKPGDFQTLLVHFPPGEQSYSKLISRPGLYAIVTVDRSSRRFLSLKFLNRQL
jgi:hypothetical protein